MNYEHLVQVNDPLNPLLGTLSLGQLWHGLVLRAEQPQRFVMGLEQCRILSRDDNVLHRELVYGPTATVRDRVTLRPFESIEYTIDATEQHVGGSLTMSIEAPDEAQLFVRFAYRTSLPTGEQADPDRTSEFVKSAYREADIDTIRVIRQMAESGDLDITSPGLSH
ncbi:SRPBCC family protein [Robbsia sp. KACC 23696]|uniref:SRPBCC family protein n=1 Tax=Robbsia sp. KACC 23696 TaxID=3149231 RepID=UPI00325BEE89